MENWRKYLIEQETTELYTPQCVKNAFSKYSEDGKSEQEAFYAAYQDCADFNFLNSLTIVHHFYLYARDEFSSTLDWLPYLSKWLENNTNQIDGALSSIGYTNLKSQVEQVKNSPIMFVLKGTISLAFKEDAQTERERKVKLKMPGKLGTEGTRTDLNYWMEKLILNKNTYTLGFDKDSPNEFIMIDPIIEKIVIKPELIEDAAKVGLNSSAQSYSAVLSNILDLSKQKNIPLVDLSGRPLEPIIIKTLETTGNNFKELAIKTLTGQLAFANAAANITLANLAAQSIKAEYVNQTSAKLWMETSYWQKMDAEFGLENIIADSKRSESPQLVNDNQPKNKYHTTAGVELLSLKNVALRALSGNPVYYLKIPNAFTDYKKLISMINRSNLSVDGQDFEWIIEDNPWLIDGSIKKIGFVVSYENTYSGGDFTDDRLKKLGGIMYWPSFITKKPVPKLYGYEFNENDNQSYVFDVGNNMQNIEELIKDPSNLNHLENLKTILFWIWSYRSEGTFGDY
tara:strand:- start:208 stop:1746 length:1539 start_codon:yes stop_codon:yes gene_type:complete